MAVYFYQMPEGKSYQANPHITHKGVPWITNLKIWFSRGDQFMEVPIAHDSTRITFTHEDFWTMIKNLIDHKPKRIQMTGSQYHIWDVNFEEIEEDEET